tara:strand:- start:19358 stop:20677 length:1320 start_codon:yes stop_codon:yes gene_type:complete
MKTHIPTYIKCASSGIYYFRCRIPKSQLHRYNGKKEIKRSLKTYGIREAIILARTLHISLHQQWQSETYTIPSNLLSLFSPNPLQKPLSTSINNTLSLNDAIERYLLSREKEGLIREKTLQMLRAKLTLLLRILGDKPVNLIKYVDAEHFKNTLLTLPPNINKSPIYRDLTITEIIETKPHKTMSLISVQGYVDYARTFMNWTIRNEWATKNHFCGIKVPNKKRPHEFRQRWKDDELSRLFSSPIHQSLEFSHPYYYWLPLLGLYTGARLNELAQLHLDDIIQIDGLWCIRIDDTHDDQRLKNQSSRRIIPLHKSLLEFGVLRYIEELRADDQLRLFPTLTSHRDGYGHYASRWFERLRTRLGLTNTGRKIDFHSFRHTIADELKQVNTPEPITAALLGQVNSNITYGRYGKEISLTAISEAINTINFPCIYQINKYIY